MKRNPKSTGGLRRLLIAAIWRRKGTSLLLSAIAALGVFASVALDGLTARQAAAMADMQRNSVISCLVTDAKGARSGSLCMPSSFVDALLGGGRGGELYEYVKNVRAKATLFLSQPSDTELRRILNFASDNSLASVEGAAIHLMEGWTEEIFLTDAPVCVISDGAAPALEEGRIPYITVAANDGAAPMELQVIGTVTGGPGNTVWCPFYVRRTATGGTPFLVDSCSFDIADNARLDACKAAVHEVFVEPDLKNPDNSGTFGVMIQDEAYQNAWEELQLSLTTLRLLLPALLVLCACTGFFASGLSARSRIREFAVMRCLGLKRRQIFAQVLGEHALLAAAGALIGGIAGLLPEGSFSGAMLCKAGICLAAFLAGSALTAWNISRVNVMKLMKVDE